MSKPVPSKEETTQKIGQLLATTELSAKQIIQQVLGKKSPVQAELQLVYGHPEWKARKERETKKKLEALKPKVPEEGKEPELAVEKVAPTEKPPEVPEKAEELKEKIIAGKPLEKGMFKELLDSGFEFLCDARPHLKRPSPASVENLDDALVEFLNTQDLREWIGKHWPKLNLIFASGVIAVPLIKQEWSHRREPKKPKEKEEEKKPEAPSKETSVEVSTAPTGSGSVTLTAKPSPPESEKPDWYIKNVEGQKT